MSEDRTVRYRALNKVFMAHLAGAIKRKGLTQGRVEELAKLPRNSLTRSLGPGGTMKLSEFVTIAEAIDADPVKLYADAYAEAVSLGLLAHVMPLRPAPTDISDARAKRDAKDAEVDRRLAEGHIQAADERDHSEMEEQPDPNGGEGA